MNARDKSIMAIHSYNKGYGPARSAATHTEAPDFDTTELKLWTLNTSANRHGSVEAVSYKQDYSAW